MQRSLSRYLPAKWIFLYEDEMNQKISWTNDSTRAKGVTILCQIMSAETTTKNPVNALVSSQNKRVQVHINLEIISRTI
jgi:hypothetical protein